MGKGMGLRPRAGEGGGVRPRDGAGGGWLVGWLVVYLLIDQNDVLVPFPVVAAA